MNRKIRHSLCSLIAVGSLVAVGCSTTGGQRDSDRSDTITHAGLYASFWGGDFSGFYTATNLVEYGDHGVGTFDQLDGEMIVVDGNVYRAASDGTLELAGAQSTPYAVLTYFEADRIFDVGPMNYERFRRAIDIRRRVAGVPQALRIEGVFRQVKLRSVEAVDAGGQQLDELLASVSREWELEAVEGVMVGYYYPDALEALHPAGYHFHFVDSARMVGGHVLDFEITQARISLDHSPVVKVILPAREETPAIARPVNPAALPR